MTSPRPLSSSTVAALQRAVDEVTTAALDERRIVGAVVLASIDGQPVVELAAGQQDREAQAPMRRDTVFRMASLTKPIVTAAALSLVDSGLIRLDDPVSRWLPTFTPALPPAATRAAANGDSASGDGGPVAPELTVRHLLTHTGGLAYGFLEGADGPYHRAGVSDGMDQPGLTMVENLRRLGSVALLNVPGERWRYSVGMDVLGAVLASATRVPLSAVVRERVTQPLGMADTGFWLPPGVPPSRLAAAYADGPDGAVRMGERHVVPFAGLAGLSFAPDRLFDPASFEAGGAGMVGTAPDMLKFLETIRGGGAPILQASTAASMMTNQIGELTLDMLGPGWGFGYGAGVLRDPAAANSPQNAGTWRWGGVYGHSWFVDPALGLTVVGMTNTSIEGMAGRYPLALRDAIYRVLAQA